MPSSRACSWPCAARSWTGGQRRQAWRNFLNHLKSLGAGDNDHDVERYVSGLAEYAISGREIRNSITTARKLAQFKGKKKNYTHLKQSLKIQGKFNKYLKGIREGVSDEQMARDKGVRQYMPHEIDR
ncbi:hypothetical protein DL766_005035 [Monosporascus sp. MC13-8B]|uniref:AAA+ ATPase lid domain-containing protein n=1 Tax=Monosporascus cannonballus TaxID=155416 RepID=A0ABY0GUF0_9PEZI|nr:hypothetical protein DL762_009186 [Monosporascus cannonballus]RYO85168.1 hypothetical protein DL763_007191 [Monosporascus cannonballus]RYP30099.1 hypothetical protein DL766_005035 [Monosporascus sp. MC13-8B]